MSFLPRTAKPKTKVYFICTLTLPEIETESADDIETLADIARKFNGKLTVETQIEEAN